MRLRRFREFEDGDTIPELGFDVVIQRRRLGTLHMETGELVACDPLNDLETEPFATTVEPGDYPVILFAAELRDDVVVAYAMLDVSDSTPVRWEVANVRDDEPDMLDPYQTGGYPVEGKLGCFMDSATAKALMDYTHSVLPDEDEFRRALLGRVRRHLNSGFGWANLDLRTDGKVPQAPENHNVIAFDAGYGPGNYVTYLGWDEDDALSHIVTDFEVLDLRFNSFPFGG